MNVFGPFLSPTPKSTLDDDAELEFTGWSIQLVHEEALIEVPIFIDTGRWTLSRREFRDYFVPTNELRWETISYNFQNRFSGSGREYVELEPALVGLHESFCQDNKQFIGWIQRVVDKLMIDSSGFWGGALGRELLNAKLEDLGFRLLEPMSHGRRLEIEIGLRLPQKNESGETIIPAYGWTVRPTSDRKIKGLLVDRVSPREHPRFSSILTNAIVGEEVSGSNLLTKSGEEMLLSKFEWTKLATLTNAEARNERIQFIRNHPEFCGNFWKLAAELKNASLYSENTPDRQIVKNLPRLLKEAGIAESD